MRCLLDLWVALAHLFYTMKYGAISRRLGLAEQASDPTHRGFVVVQMDGLSHQDLLQAMDQGYAPYLKKLLATGEFRLAPYRCGLPSTTPAAQAGILFGDNFDVPAFRWYEKDTRSVIVPKTPGPVQALQERLSQGRPGILEGGSSYVNMMDGGASFSLFTLGALNKRRLFAGVRGLGLLGLILLSPWRALRILTLSVWEYLAQMVEGTLARLGHQPRVSDSVLFPFVRIVSNVLFRELQTFAVIVDLYRGVPAVYTNYYGYDEIAHRYGPDSRPAYRALRGIDRQIKQIDRMCRYSSRLRYDLYVLSDHGQTPTIPFRQIHGCTLGQYIARHNSKEIDEPINGAGFSQRQAEYLIDELEALEKQGAKPPAALARRARHLLERQMPLEEDQGERVSKEEEIEVLNSGSLAHVYVNRSTRQLTWREIERLHPGLVEALVNQEGVGLVVTRAEDGVYVLSKEGKAPLDGRGGANDLLSRFEEPAVAEAQLRYLASFPHSGDLIVFGAYRDGQVVGFEEQVGSHGGLGGPQCYPFILYSSRYQINTEEMINAKELYPHFMKTYHNRTENREQRTERSGV